MAEVFKYGEIRYEGALPGDLVRFVPGPVGRPGAVMKPRNQNEVNAVLQSIRKGVGFIKLRPQLQAAQAGAESGGASGISINLPVTAGGTLRIS